jgi:hypothetical protein
LSFSCKALEIIAESAEVLRTFEPPALELGLLPDMATKTVCGKFELRVPMDFPTNREVQAQLSNAVERELEAVVGNHLPRNCVRVLHMRPGSVIFLIAAVGAISGILCGAWLYHLLAKYFTERIRMPPILGRCDVRALNAHPEARDRYADERIWERLGVQRWRRLFQP